jgi:hypothetical protein
MRERGRERGGREREGERYGGVRERMYEWMGGGRDEYMHHKDYSVEQIC